MKQTLFILCLILITTQTLFAQSSEQALQELAQELMQKLMSDIKNPEQNSSLLVDIQDNLRPHSDFFFNIFPEMQTYPEFEPYIEKYEALKGQYMGSGQPMPINPDIKIVLTASPFFFAPSYDETLENSGVCFDADDALGLIIIDRGFWEYYQDNDEIRGAVLIHELGHCDLKQGHGHNAIMGTAWGDDLLNSRTINWQPLYEEFFMIGELDIDIMCSEENMHLYEKCSSPPPLRVPRGSRTCFEEENDTNCYRWKEDFIDGLRSGLPVLINSLGF